MARFVFAGALLAMLLAGCATSDWLLGLEAEEAKDYATARDAYQRDLQMALADTSGTDVSRARILRGYYEVGRMTGYLCDYEEAERLLREALRLGELMPHQYSQLTATLSELARLTFDAGKFDQSVSFYERAVERIDKYRLADRDPITFANYLDDYAAALERAGNPSKARDARTRAVAIRTASPTKSADFTPMYYREVCGAG